MSLSNLPRAITQKIIRPNPIQAEREEYERVQVTALQKAINTDEVPAKEKHVRTLIIGTFQEKSAHTFWAFVNSRIPVQGNPVVAWKFCYVLHKILRDGHPNVLKDSIRHHPFLVDLGRLWGHLKLGHGPLITKYCELLAVKLDFHRKNPRFPGNLHITNDELGRIAENDVNNYFQLSVEIFDYMECILDLAAGIFASFDMSRANSMTNAGQCRLVVLIPCILDSCQLYDFIVKMMFRLHTSLPQDVLTGHRERFSKQFKLLQHLYSSSGNLQFFKNLLQIPSLPEKAPNFFSAVGLNEHVTPVAKVQEVPEEAGGDHVEGLLVDTASTNGNYETNLRQESVQETPSTNGFGNGFAEDQAAEKEMIINELLQETERLRRVADKIKSDDLIVIEDLRNRVVELERDSEEQKAQADMEKEAMMHQIEQSSQNPQVVANFEELDKRAKATDEKFKKMRDVYNELREKHVTLLRSSADAEKQLKQTKKTLEELERQKNELNIRILNFDMEREQLQNSASASAEVQREVQEKVAECRTLKNQLAGLQAELDSAHMTREKLHEEQQAAIARQQQLQQQLETAESDLDSVIFQHNLQKKTLHRNFLNVICSAAADQIQHCIQTWEQPAFAVLTSTPEFLLLCIQPVLDHLSQLDSLLPGDEDQVPEIARELQMTFSHMTHCLIQCQETAHMAPVDLTDEFSLLATKLSEHSLDYLTGFREDPQAVRPILSLLQESLEALQHLSTILIPKVEDVRVDEVADQVEKELHDMDKAIEAAALKIEEMLANSRTRDSGVTLEVNAKILDSCTTLMTAVRVLVRKSRALQQEIVAAGKGFSSPKEFYKRNHRWTEGLISAAKTIGLGANVLLEAADKVVSGKGKFEELVVASQEISAGTVQLVVSSRVKADKNSRALAEMSVASKSVTQATGNVVASAKDCAQLVEEKADLDFTGVTLHKIKKIEMESQVKVLELESLLTKERERLSSIRRQHYALVGTNENEN